LQQIPAANIANTRTAMRVSEPNSRSCGAAVETFGPFIRTYIGVLSVKLYVLYANSAQNAREKTGFTKI